jgi:hypothetical protein
MYVELKGKFCSCLLVVSTVSPVVFVVARAKAKSNYNIQLMYLNPLSNVCRSMRTATERKI